jgi:signal transduction histidine kinase
MTRRRIPVGVFLLTAVLVLIVLPLASGSTAWLIERHRQQSAVENRLTAANAYLGAHIDGIVTERKAAVLGIKRRLAELHLLAELGIVDKTRDQKPIGKTTIFSSASAEEFVSARDAQAQKRLNARLGGIDAAARKTWHSRDISIPIRPAKGGAALIGTLYYRPPSLTTRALVALAAGVLVLLAGLAIGVWLVGRWIVNPLSRLSSQVDDIAGGDLTVAVPPSRISEVANVAAAIDGMASALSKNGQQQAAADEARRFLITAVAHDLRTPLFALRGHLEAITSELGDADEHLARAEDRAAALERLIASLFAYVREDYAPQEPSLEHARLGDLVRKTAAGFRSGAFRFDGDEDLLVAADRERLDRVLSNVFDNALRHSPPGEAVDVSWSSLGSEVEITIADRGGGIDPDFLPLVFEPLARGDRSRNASTGGTGLGLTIAERLIESQGGTIAAGNRRGGGAEFTLTLRAAG